MFVVTLISFIAIFFAQLEAQKKISFGFAISFLLVAFVQAFHYDFGNDYIPYMREFYINTYAPFSLTYIWDYLGYRDPGWVVLEYLFKPVGFFGLVAFLSIFQNTVYFYFIKKFVPGQFIGLALFVYLFEPTLYLLNMSMMRQGFTESIFFISIMLALKRNVHNIIIAALLMLVAGTIHASSYAMIPFIFWPLIPMKNAKKLVPILLVVFALCFFSSTFLDSVMKNLFALQLFSRFEHYNTLQASSGGFGFVLLSIPSLIMLFFLSKNNNEKENHIVSIAVLERIIIPFASAVMLASRMAIFFVQFYLIAFPLAIGKVKDLSWRIAIIVIYVLMHFYQYIGFCKSETYGEYYAQYHTIFEVLFQ